MLTEISDDFKIHENTIELLMGLVNKVFVHLNSISLSSQFSGLKYANSPQLVLTYFRTLQRIVLYIKEQHLAKYDERKLASDFQISGI